MYNQKTLKDQTTSKDKKQESDVILLIEEVFFI